MEQAGKPEKPEKTQPENVKPAKSGSEKKGEKVEKGEKVDKGKKKAMEVIPIIEKEKVEKKPNENSEKGKAKVVKKKEEEPKEEDQGQKLLDNIITSIGAMARDPSMASLLYGFDDSMLNSDRPTVIPSADHEDIDYIIIPL